MFKTDLNVRVCRVLGQWNQWRWNPSIVEVPGEKGTLHIHHKHFWKSLHLLANNAKYRHETWSLQQCDQTNIKNHFGLTAFVLIM